MSVLFRHRWIPNEQETMRCKIFISLHLALREPRKHSPKDTSKSWWSVSDLKTCQEAADVHCINTDLYARGLGFDMDVWL